MPDNTADTTGLGPWYHSRQEPPPGVPTVRDGEHIRHHAAQTADRTYWLGLNPITPDHGLATPPSLQRLGIAPLNTAVDWYHYDYLRSREGLFPATGTQGLKSSLKALGGGDSSSYEVRCETPLPKTQIVTPRQVAVYLSRDSEPFPEPFQPSGYTRVDEHGVIAVPENYDGFLGPGRTCHFFTTRLMQERCVSYILPEQMGRKVLSTTAMADGGDPQFIEAYVGENEVYDMDAGDVISVDEACDRGIFRGTAED